MKRYVDFSTFAKFDKTEINDYSARVCIPFMEHERGEMVHVRVVYDSGKVFVNDIPVLFSIVD